LVGDVLLQTAFLSYAGPFALNDRAALLENWIRYVKQQQIPFSENLDDVDAQIDANDVCCI